MAADHLAAISDDSLREAILITDLPSNSWCEGIALRPGGKGVVISRLDQPELYLLDPRNQSETCQTVSECIDAESLISMCAIRDCPDEYIVLAGSVDRASVEFHNTIMWRVKLEDQPDQAMPVVTVSKVAAPPDSSASFLSPASVSKHTALAVDHSKHCIWQVDLRSGRCEVLSADDHTMTTSQPGEFGLNRVLVRGGYLWYTNSAKGLLCRLPLENAGDAEGEEWEQLKVTGPVEVVAEGMVNCNGWEITRDLSTAYVVNWIGGYMWRVTINPATGKGQPEVVLPDIVSPSTLVLHYPEEGANGDAEAGKPSLYIICDCKVEPSWTADHDNSNWSAFATVKQTFSIEVTSEAAEA